MMNRQKKNEEGSTPLERKNNGIPQLLDDTVTGTYEDVISIIEAKIELVKIELTEKISSVAAWVILGVILIIGIAYLLTTVALLTGELMGHPFLGYLLVSLLFFSGFAFFFKFRPSLLKNMIQKILLSVHDYTK